MIVWRLETDGTLKVISDTGSPDPPAPSKKCVGGTRR